MAINSYPCPNPPKRGKGCGCPTSSTRCYGAIRAVRERFRETFSEYGLTAAIQMTLHECEPQWGWTEAELMRRFLTVTRVQ